MIYKLNPVLLYLGISAFAKRRCTFARLGNGALDGVLVVLAVGLLLLPLLLVQPDRSDSQNGRT
ncbi:MAG: hypothetical protein ACERIE_08780, partial [Methyloceanibacter sp.]